MSCLSDIVGYSKLLTNEQRERQQELESDRPRARSSSERLKRRANWCEFRRATGWCWPFSPARMPGALCGRDQPTHCAAGTHLPLRMGIHSGPVDLVEDVNDKPNLAGAGVNIASG